MINFRYYSWPMNRLERVKKEPVQHQTLVQSPVLRKDKGRYTLSPQRVLTVTNVLKSRGVVYTFFKIAPFPGRMGPISLPKKKSRTKKINIQLPWRSGIVIIQMPHNFYKLTLNSIATKKEKRAQTISWKILHRSFTYKLIIDEKTSTQRYTFGLDGLQFVHTAKKENVVLDCNIGQKILKANPHTLNVDYWCYENPGTTVSIGRRGHYNFTEIANSLFKYERHIDHFLKTKSIRSFSKIPFFIQIILVKLVLRDPVGVHLFHGTIENYKNLDNTSQKKRLKNTLDDLCLLYSIFRYGNSFASQDIGILMYGQWLQSFLKDTSLFNKEWNTFCKTLNVMGHLKRYNSPDPSGRAMSSGWAPVYWINQCSSADFLSSSLTIAKFSDALNSMQVPPSKYKLTALGFLLKHL